MDYPYQLIARITQEPRINEAIYEGERGWLPHIALKRRFRLVGIDETELCEKLSELASQTSVFDMHLGEVKKPEMLPVRVIEVIKTPELLAFHNRVFDFFGGHVQSKFPERELGNYFPHITIENHDREQVVDPTRLVGSIRPIDHFWLVKDPEDGENAYALARFKLVEKKT